MNGDLEADASDFWAALKVPASFVVGGARIPGSGMLLKGPMHPFVTIFVFVRWFRLLVTVFSDLFRRATPRANRSMSAMIVNAQFRASCLIHTFQTMV